MLKLSCGEKEEKPRTFVSEEDRQMYLAQKEMEEQIKRIKSQKKGDSDGLLKSFLVIQLLLLYLRLNHSTYESRF